MCSCLPGRRRRETGRVSNPEIMELGITLNIVLANVTASLQTRTIEVVEEEVRSVNWERPLTGVREIDYECM